VYRSIQLRETGGIKQFEISSQQDVVLQLSSGPQTIAYEPTEFGISLTAAAFGKVS